MRYCDKALYLYRMSLVKWFDQDHGRTVNIFQFFANTDRWITVLNCTLFAATNMWYFGVCEYIQQPTKTSLFLLLIS
jgi:hypothetical protein